MDAGPFSVGRRADRLSIDSSSSSTSDLSLPSRKKKYDDVEPRYLNYTESKVFCANMQTQVERRKMLEERNALKSQERATALKTYFAEKQLRVAEEQDEEVRRGKSLHKYTEAIRKKERDAIVARRRKAKDDAKGVGVPAARKGSIKDNVNAVEA
ncbi:TPA: hypothetical protein N0F65_012348 [Lagenidium giganteum]|uniref:Ribosomal RNA-processing protein 36 n=1 Tax=Lagenidium giganteum TaxID=4803 RepID=A0AAV2YGJ9_9STRA|nr:TPA: hypothetical protein N0F65_012348 [Lagenidium giganteum]